jgi:hypothetical protein
MWYLICERLFAMSISVSESRLLRWTFRRDDQTVVCELGLNSDLSAYQLRLSPPSDLLGTPERFEDAMRAFQRQAVIERLLVDEGWMLEGFESVGGATLAVLSHGG